MKKVFDDLIHQVEPMQKQRFLTMFMKTEFLIAAEKVGEVSPNVCL